MPGVALIGSPYDAARHGWRMGRGPLELLAGRDDVAWLEDPEGAPYELARTFALTARLAEMVADAAATGALPVVVAGNCNVAMAQVGRADAIVWLDAHGDLNTPKTTTSGFVDGMALTLCLGETLDALRATIPGYRGVTGDRVVLVGARDLDAPEVERIAAHGIRHVPAADVRAQSPSTYLHIDLDVLDLSVGRVNAFSCPGGLSVEEVVGVVERLRPSLAAASLTAWDPALDADGRVRAAAREILAALGA